MKNNRWNVCGIIIGVLIIIAGIVIFTQDQANHADYASFGADFYTYSYEATRYAANNIAALYYLVAKSMGLLLVSIGMITICGFGSKMTKNSEDIESKEPPIASTVETQEQIPDASITE